MEVKKEIVISSLFWKLSEKVSSQVIQLIVSIVLARLLSPDDYGIIALITVFISIMNVLVEGGLNKAIIQGTEITDVDCNSVFAFNMLFAVILYCIA